MPTSVAKAKLINDLTQMNIINITGVFVIMITCCVTDTTVRVFWIYRLISEPLYDINKPSFHF